MLVGDSRSKVDVRLISDPRATHYWDQERLLGIWFAEQEAYESMTFGPIAWDTYFLYGPEANWEDVPWPVATHGRTVIAASKNLENNIRELLTAD